MLAVQTPENRKWISKSKMAAVVTRLNINLSLLYLMYRLIATSAISLRQNRKDNIKILDGSRRYIPAIELIITRLNNNRSRLNFVCTFADQKPQILTEKNGKAV